VRWLSFIMLEYLAMAQAMRWIRRFSASCRRAASGAPQVADVRGTELVQMIARQAAGAMLALNKYPTAKRQVLPPVLVGVGANKRRILQLLGAAAGKPTVVLLHGMAGIGKTTLAKAVFNELHERDPTTPCCFLEVWPGIRDSNALLQMQRTLLQELSGQKLELSNSSQAVRLMEQKLRGRRVLVVVDNVWGNQLEQLLPACALKVLGEGSVVLVTSQDQDADEHLQSFAAQDAAGIHLVEEGVECLTPLQSLELFCWHAIGLTRLLDVEKDLQSGSTAVGNWRRASSTGCSSAILKWLVEEVRQAKSLAWDNDSVLRQLQLFVERCGGLPMALELLGRHLARLESGYKSQHFFARPTKSFQAVYSKSGMFPALWHSWDALGEGELKDVLLDIVWFLQDRSWKLVECFGTSWVLSKLQRLGLIQKFLADGGGRRQAVVRVHPVVTDFCTLGSNETSNQLRQECHQDDESCPDASERLDLDTLMAIMVRYTCVRA
jgi:hypothetical protein